MTQLKDLPFKACSTCGEIWQTRKKFLDDINVQLIGYQAHFSDPSKGLVLFKHKVSNCGTTIALKVEQFETLYNGTKHNQLLALTDICPQYCLDEQNFEKCENKCSMAYVREILNEIKVHKEALKKAV